MKPKANIENDSGKPSVRASLTRRGDAGHQQITRDWWATAEGRFQLVASQLVVDEASAGDPRAASRRQAALEPVTLLDATDEALSLAQELVGSGAIPANSPEDATQIAIAVANGVEYLDTWNCRHIANATLRSRIERICRARGYEPAVICTADELMEPENDNA